MTEMVEFLSCLWRQSTILLKQASKRQCKKEESAKRMPAQLNNVAIKNKYATCYPLFPTVHVKEWRRGIRYCPCAKMHI